TLGEYLVRQDAFGMGDDTLRPTRVFHVDGDAEHPALTAGPHTDTVIRLLHPPVDVALRGGARGPLVDAPHLSAEVVLRRGLARRCHPAFRRDNRRWVGHHR